MHAIRIDRAKRLGEEPDGGHNRFHPDIPPVLEVGEGEEVALETRDALDGQLKPGTTVANFPSLDVGAVHPLTGPVYVKGAAPGDLLEIEFTDIIAEPVAFSAIMPGLGFLRDVMTESFLAHWETGPPRRRSRGCVSRARRSWGSLGSRRRPRSSRNGRLESSASSTAAAWRFPPTQSAPFRRDPVALPA